MSAEDKVLFKLTAAERSIFNLETQVAKLMHVMKMQQTYIDSLDAKELDSKERVLADVVYRVKQLEKRTTRLESKSFMEEEIDVRLSRLEARQQFQGKLGTSDEILKIERRFLNEIDNLRQEHRKSFEKLKCATESELQLTPSFTKGSDEIKDALVQAIRSRDQVLLELSDTALSAEKTCSQLANETLARSQNLEKRLQSIEKKVHQESISSMDSSQYQMEAKLLADSLFKEKSSRSSTPTRVLRPITNVQVKRKSRSTSKRREVTPRTTRKAGVS
mmetsp:Transcript_1345/g.3110  ORF Transcript_1345/g.3110 Transcript_1345/m.3110 type:complete len:276 (+) Transcript_1345:753-1580(+)